MPALPRAVARHEGHSRAGIILLGSECLIPLGSGHINRGASLMRMVFVLLLLLFWLFLAARAWQRGDVSLAIVLALIGVALTAWRLRRV